MTAPCPPRLACTCIIAISALEGTEVSSDCPLHRRYYDDPEQIRLRINRKAAARRNAEQRGFVVLDLERDAERLARAMCAPPARAWSRMSDQYRERWLAEARAVLARLAEQEGQTDG